jgi:hypothetical protein
MIEDYGDGNFYVSNTMLSMNKTIPEAEMRAVLPVMRVAERKISSDCGLPINVDMRHSCNWRPCDPRNAP